MKKALLLLSFLFSAVVYSATPTIPTECCYDAAAGGDPPPPPVDNPDVYRWYDGDGTATFGQRNYLQVPLDPAYQQGQQGLGCSKFNIAGYIEWKNSGGDWVDANNVPQGSAPFASATFGTSTNRPVEIDVTSVLPFSGLVLRKSGSGANIVLASKENTNTALRPYLEVTLSTGAVQQILPDADSAMVFTSPTTCSGISYGKAATMTLNYAIVLGWNSLPANITSAILKFTVISSSGTINTNVFRAEVPRGDVVLAPPVDPNPEILYYEPFTQRDWWTRNGGTKVPNSQWTHEGGTFITPNSRGLFWADGSGDFLAYGSTATNPRLYPRGTGKIGQGLIVQHKFDRVEAGTEWDPVSIIGRQQQLGIDPAVELDEAWFSYWVKYDSNYANSDRCEGGKAPGLAASNLKCANSGQQANGLCGWSFRMSYKVLCDPNNPVYDYVFIFVYAYHGLMPGHYGQTWGHERSYPTKRLTTPNALLKKGEWHCIEQHVKMNSLSSDPGDITTGSDGIVRVYVNGKLAIERVNAYMRSVAPPQGYGGWRLLSGYPASTYPEAATAPRFVDRFGREAWLQGGTAPSTGSTGTFVPGYTELKIRQGFMSVHHGGVTAFGNEAIARFDEFIISRKRSGCAQGN